MTNALRVIAPYWFEGTWVFDDDTVGLVREPFVEGVPEMIDELVAGVERVKAEARGWPVNAIRLDAYDGASGGGPFYEKCGFAEVGRAVYRGVPLIYFELLL